MQKWTRWQDWVALAAGAYALLSPIWTATDTTATWTMVILGVLTAATALWSLAMPDATISEYSHALLGVLFFVSPWVMGFAHMNAMAATAWVVGVITFAVGAWGAFEVNRMHHVASSH